MAHLLIHQVVSGIMQVFADVHGPVSYTHLHKESDGLEVYGSLKVDSMGKRVYIKDKEISLTTREYELLSLLVRNPRKIYGRDNLLHEVWGCLLYTSRCV